MSRVTKIKTWRSRIWTHEMSIGATINWCQKIMFLKQWFSLSHKIDSIVTPGVALSGLYLKVRCLVFALSHANEENCTLIVGIAGTLLSTACAKYTTTFNYVPPLKLACSSVYVHSLYGLCAMSSGILTTLLNSMSLFFYQKHSWCYPRNEWIHFLGWFSKCIRYLWGKTPNPPHQMFIMKKYRIVIWCVIFLLEPLIFCVLKIN